MERGQGRRKGRPLATFALWRLLAVVLALLLSLVLSWKQLDFYELRPILSGGVKDLPKRVYLLLSVPFGEVFYAAAVLGGQGTRIRNGLLRACVLAGILLSVLYVRNICRRIQRQVCCRLARRFSAEKC